MKILLIQPRVCSEAAFPLGLATLIPHLQAAGWRVQGMDLSFDALETVAQQALRHDALGITVMTRALPQVTALIARIRARAGRPPPIVIGGPHPSLFPVESLRQTRADAAIVGDGEEAFPTLLAHLSGSTEALPAGAYLREGDHIQPPRNPIATVALDGQPFADRTVFPLHRYSAAMRSLAQPYTTMVTSRGCRRHCPFCPAPALGPKGFRGRSPAQVYAEMADLALAHGVRSVHFEDDDPIADRSRFEALLETLIAQPLPLVWECVNGLPPERLPLELLPKMARAGCRSIVISVETLRTTPHPEGIGHAYPQIRRLVRRAQAEGITVGGYFMLGLPRESVRDMLRSIRGSWKLGMSRANYSPFQWLPGSHYWRERGKLDGETPGATLAGQLATLAHVGFYLHPRPFARLLADLARDPQVLPAVAARVVEQFSGGTGAV